MASHDGLQRIGASAPSSASVGTDRILSPF
jgi:hypothetical protein